MLLTAEHRSDVLPVPIGIFDRKLPWLASAKGGLLALRNVSASYQISLLTLMLTTSADVGGLVHLRKQPRWCRELGTRDV